MQGFYLLKSSCIFRFTVEKLAHIHKISKIYLTNKKLVDFSLKLFYNLTNGNSAVDYLKWFFGG